MYIAGLKYKSHGSTSFVSWRFSSGAGKFRPVIAISDSTQNHDSIANAIVFALSGKRNINVAEVSLDVADDAGDMWTIERGANGSVFRKNNRLLSLEETQRSLLASILDLDVSLSQSEALVAPIELRQIIGRGDEVAATLWNIDRVDIDRPSFTAKTLREFAAKASELAKDPEFANPQKLAKIAEKGAKLLGSFQEIQTQKGFLAPQSQSSKQNDRNADKTHNELDVLNQIEHYLRRINDGGETFGHLSAMFERYNSRISTLELKWSKETLGRIQAHQKHEDILTVLIRLRAWSRFRDLVNQLMIILNEQIKPLNASGQKVWSDFSKGISGTGQDLESCLASMLLGVKQVAQEIERYSSLDIGGSTAIARPQTWFEKLRASNDRSTDSKSRLAAPALQAQRDWVHRLAREIEAVKVSAEQSLYASQNISEKMTDARSKLQQESLEFAEISKKVSIEFERLFKEWMLLAQDLGISSEIGIESLVDLIKDASDHLILSDVRREYSQRIDDRRSVQTSLESCVRPWWDIIGSHKPTDLSNLSFLIVEAKGALRYREGRRQKLQNGLEQEAKDCVDRAIDHWIKRRTAQIETEWKELFNDAGLPVMPLSNPHAIKVIELAGRCGVFMDFKNFEEQEQFKAASLWPSRLDSAVTIYNWRTNTVSEGQRQAFLKLIDALVGDGQIPVILLLSDRDFADHMIKLGTGYGRGSVAEIQQEVIGSRVQGAVGKQTSNPERVLPSPRGKVPEDGVAKKPMAKSVLSSKAEAALRVLNPKTKRI